LAHAVGNIMIRKSEIAVAALILFAVSSTTVPAQDARLPKLDIEYACHASAKAVEAIISVTSDIYKSCVDDENEARQQLEKEWSNFSASDKSQCITPKEYVPGYVEWITCLEMTRDVKVMRKGQPPVTSSDVHECPLVRFLEDGTITSVNTAC
jgi:hypothetical protein